MSEGWRLRLREGWVFLTKGFCRNRWKDWKAKRNLLPWGWYLALLVVAGGGVATFIWGCQTACFVPVLGKNVVWGRLIGSLLVAIPTCHLVVFLSLWLARYLFETDINVPRRNLWGPALVGVLENVMYPAALLAGAKEFIGLWLLLKVAGQWPRWGLAPEEDASKLDEGRRRYFLFLLGSGIQVMLGAITYAFARVYLTTP